MGPGTWALFLATAKPPNHSTYGCDVLADNLQSSMRRNLPDWVWSQTEGGRSDWQSIFPPRSSLSPYFHICQRRHLCLRGLFLPHLGVCRLGAQIGWELAQREIWELGWENGGGNDVFTSSVSGQRYSDLFSWKTARQSAGSEGRITYGKSLGNGLGRGERAKLASTYFIH